LTTCCDERSEIHPESIFDPDPPYEIITYVRGFGVKEMTPFSTHFDIEFVNSVARVSEG